MIRARPDEDIQIAHFPFQASFTFSLAPAADFISSTSAAAAGATQNAWTRTRPMLADEFSPAEERRDLFLFMGRFSSRASSTPRRRKKTIFAAVLTAMVQANKVDAAAAALMS